MGWAGWLAGRQAAGRRADGDTSKSNRSDEHDERCGAGGGPLDIVLFVELPQAFDGSAHGLLAAPQFELFIKLGLGRQLRHAGETARGGGGARVWQAQRWRCQQNWVNSTDRQRATPAVQQAETPGMRGYS